MKRWPETAMTAAALLLVCLFMPGMSGPEIFGPTRRNTGVRNDLPYHGGKSPSLPRPDPSCQSDKCHGAFPHKKERTESVFRNMHQGTMDCLSCHGKDGEQHWEGRMQPDGKGWKIAYSAPAVKGDPHAALGGDASCRKCHSESGRKMLLEKGVPELSQGFADPIALRMIEGGSRRWVPADKR